MLVFSAVVGLAARNAQADDRRLAEVRLERARVDETLEQFPVQFAKRFRRAETRLSFVVLQQQHAEVIVPDIRGEVVPDNALNALVGLAIDNVGFQNFN